MRLTISLQKYKSNIRTKNGGSCFDDNGQQQISCQCFDTFTGSRCETNLCDDFTCENGGNCVVSDNDPENFQLKCDCLYGFDGEYCQRDICSEIQCKNSGNCTVDESDPENLKPKCDCKDDFVGETCDIPLVCFDGDPCQNGSECKLLNGTNASDQECCT